MKLRRLVTGLLLALLAACVETGGPERVEGPEETGATDATGGVTDGDGATAGGGDGGDEAGVPIRLAGPGGAALLVPVEINGSGPWDFILDTGATFTCVDGALADSLDLPEPRGRVGIGQGIQGGPGEMRLVEIERIEVGSAAAEGLTGCALDLARFESIGIEARGLLGLNFLTSFRMTLDFEEERLILTRR